MQDIFFEILVTIGGIHTQKDGGQKDGGQEDGGQKNGDGRCRDGHTEPGGEPARGEELPEIIFLPCP